MSRLLLGVLISCLIPVGASAAQTAPPDTVLAPETVVEAARLIGLQFTPAEIDTMVPDLLEHRDSYRVLRELDVANSVPPALLLQIRPLGMDPAQGLASGPARWSDPGEVVRPDDLNDLAHWSVGQLARLIETRQVTSVELTELYLDRLESHDKTLLCVVTLTRERALAAATRADAEMESGLYRGPLHGMPFGAKDLFAVPGYKTTWGATPYQEQTLDDTATVVRKLEDAGAVLVAKLTLGALAWGDVWFGGMTRNPWNTEQGSSGSSAGSASAVAAGLVPFALGTETLGSIVSPSTRCGCTGLRPTFGRVSRAGAMALSWSMDKVGPICRTVEDCALVFDVIRGPDGRDQTVNNAPFGYQPEMDLGKLRIGYLESAFNDEDPHAELDSGTLEVLRGLGAELIPMELPSYPVNELAFILSAEAAAAFDQLTVSDRDDELVRQVRYAWPNVFRYSRMIPAVEYIQANRVRWQVIQAMAELMEDIDVYVAPTFGGDNLVLTNLTGHPCVVLPNGFRQNGAPHSITFTGDLFDEATLLAVAKAYQDATDFHRQHPPGF